MPDLLLVVALAGERVAVPAAEVESVVEIERLTPVPGAAAHIAGLSAVRSRVLTAIDCRAALLPGDRVEQPRDALVVVREGHGFGLLVDFVEDVAEALGPLAPVPPGLAPHWSRVVAGYVPTAGGLLLLVDIDALIAGPLAAASTFTGAVTNRG